MNTITYDQKSVLIRDFQIGKAYTLKTHIGKTMFYPVTKDQDGFWCFCTPAFLESSKSFGIHKLYFCDRSEFVEVDVKDIEVSGNVR